MSKIYQIYGEDAHGMTVKLLEAADAIRALCDKAGCPPCFHTPTNQVFVRVEDRVLAPLADRVEFSFWEKADETHTILRFASSWATRMEDVEKLGQVLRDVL